MSLKAHLEFGGQTSDTLKGREATTKEEMAEAEQGWPPNGFKVTVFPEAAGVAIPSANTPGRVYDLYLEGCKVLPTSLRLAAASFRVCLEAFMNDQGHTGGNLASKIDAFIDDTSHHVPSEIADCLKPLKDGGNIACHDALHILDRSIEIEPEEVEQFKGVIEMLFDEFHEQPARRKAMIQSIGNKKRNWKS